MKFRQLMIVVIIIIVSTGLWACKNKDGNINDAIAAGVAATLTKEAWEADLEAARLTEQAQPPAATPEPDIIHVSLPDYSEGSNTFVSDFSSQDYAADRSTVGDFYQMNRMERPFSAEEMDYFGDLDITRVDLKYDAPWFYATFFLAEQLREGVNTHYGLEFDLDIDGRGDFLVWAALPANAEWTTDGVQVLEDGDNDVGGVIPLQMEDPNINLNGYETVIFDSGVGTDPDLAWVRRDPEETSQVQIAYKDSFLGEDGFLWGAWADEGLMDPGLFDYNDQVTFTVAGSPAEDSPEYPLKAVPRVDSTCRSWYGLTPTGDEPGLCTIQEEKKPSGGDQPRTGFCIATLSTTHVGGFYCLGGCLPECPRGRICLACALP